MSMSYITMSFVDASDIMFCHAGLRWFFFFFFCVFFCFFSFFFFFKQKTAYEIRNCDWSSDVCSSDLVYIIQNLTILLSNKIVI